MAFPQASASSSSSTATPYNTFHPLPQPSPLTQQQSSAVSRVSTGSNNTYVMSASPRKTNRKKSHEPYMPKIITTVGQRPACLVNASVTYVGNDQIYAFGGFDQYTDEGMYIQIYGIQV